jgi:two-component system, NarL family, nitrate/nitrite response regulator NarL
VQTHTSTIIVAERPLLREGIVSLLYSSGYKIIAAVSQASEVQDLLQADLLQARRDRVLIILGLTGAGCDYEGLAQNIGRFRSLSSDAKIVVVAEAAGPVDLQRIMLLAPDSYIVNLSSREILLKALELALLDQKIFVLGEKIAGSSENNINGPHQRAMNGGHAAEARTISSDGAGSCAPNLSPRELEVLVRLSRGDSNKQIARSCSMAEATVKVHLKTILRKLDVQNRTQAAIAAIARGLVGGDTPGMVSEPNAPVIAAPGRMRDYDFFTRQNRGRGRENEMSIA